MPDQDIVERSLRSPWKAVYRLIKGEQRPEFICAEINRALGIQLRLDGGVPALGAISEAVAVATRSPEQSREFNEVLRFIEHRFNHSGSAKGTAEGGRRLLERIETRQALPGTLALAEEHCWGLVDRHFFGRIHRFVGTLATLPTFETLSRVREECRTILQPQIRQIARKLVADPTASHLRVPAFSLSRPVTAALLDEAL